MKATALPSLVLKPDNLHEKPLSNYWRIHMLFRCLNLTCMLSFPPLQGGTQGGIKKLTQTCPHETRPRESGEWGKEVFTR